MGIKTFTLRLTEEQLDYVDNKSKELGISKNDYIRRLIDNDIISNKQDRILEEIITIKEMLLKEDISILKVLQWLSQLQINILKKD